MDDEDNNNTITADVSTANGGGRTDFFRLGGGGQQGGGEDGLTELEQEVLEEYERLSGNMRKLNTTLSSIISSSSSTTTRSQPHPSTTPATGGAITLEIAEGLRRLERKVASVYTLMKASVYSIVLQQGSVEGEGEG